ncbi:MAG: T9SS type A sorting domain-containing protein [candidate division Zixibacteria bacterium]|nr:T9SS type A sorting domain-containing protein [candidate division Zixibacteria bacterium]
MKFHRILLTSVFLLALCSTAPAEVITFDDNWGENGFNLVGQDPSGVEVVHSIESMFIDNVDIDGQPMQVIGIPGVMLPNNAGAPNLPGHGRMIAIPAGATAELRILDSETEVLTDMVIAPAPPIPFENDDSPIVFEKDPDIYSRDQYYPQNPVMISQPARMRGVDYIILGITPFQYNPVSGELLVYKNLKVEVKFSGGYNRFGEDRLRNRYWEPILRENLINYETLPKMNFDRRIEPADDDEFEYVIIVPDDGDFISWADTLKLWRNQQGISTGIFTLSDIGGNSISAIEGFVDDAYENWDTPPVAVLLLSDYQDSGDNYGITSPMWNNYCVSDNIYADYDSDNLPDIAFARITAQNNDHLSTMIQKMLDYERNPPTYDGFYDHPVIAGGWQTERWFILCTEICAGYLERVLGKEPVKEYAIYSGTPGNVWSTNPNTPMLVNYFGPLGYEYIEETPEYLTDWGGNATRLNNDLNDGAFMLLHRDHGGETGWGEPDYGIGDLFGLENEMYPFVFTINCLTGRYNWSGQCFTEAFHRMDYGALGLTAASEVSYSFVNDTYIFGIMDLIWPGFDPEYGEDGDVYPLPAFANVSGKHYLQASGWPYNPQHKVYTHHLFHHHGDAFMTMYTEMPQDLSVNHAEVLFSGLNQFTVTADEGSFIALTSGGEIIGVAEGTGGPVSVPITPQNPNTVVKVTVTKPDYFRYENDIDVIPPEGYGVVHGHVSDLLTSDPLEGMVSVTNREPLIISNCNSDGYYSMYVPADSVWQIRAEYTSDYLPEFAQVTVNENDTIQRNFALEPKTEVVLKASFGNPEDIQYRTFYARGSWDDDGYHNNQWDCSFSPMRDDGVQPDETANDGIFTGLVQLGSDDNNTFNWAVFSEDYNDQASKLQDGSSFSIDSPGAAPNVPVLNVNPSGNENNWTLTVFSAEGLNAELEGGYNDLDYMWSGSATMNEGTTYNFRIYPMHANVAAYGRGGVGGSNFSVTPNYSEEFNFIFNDNTDSLEITSAHPAPEGLAASLDMDEQVMLDWSAPDITPQSYKIYRGTNENGPFSQIGSVNHPTMTYLDEGLQNYTEYYYYVSAVYPGNIESIASNITMGYAITGARLSVNPDSFAPTLYSGDTMVTEMIISNTGDLDLNYLIGDNEIDNGGGPDEFGYAWMDSDEHNGPDYNWIDITGIGTPVTFQPDNINGNSGPLELGFEFPYYGISYGQINVCTNGWASFTDSTSISGGTRPFPHSYNPNCLLGLFVDNLTFEHGGGAYFYTNNSDTAIITWDHIRDWRQTGVFTFQAILTASGRIVYQYAEVGPGRLDQCGIGIENENGSIGLQVAYSEEYLHSNMAIKFYRDWIRIDSISGIIEPDGADTVAVMFDARNLPPGQYEGTIDISGWDIYHEEEPASLAVLMDVDEPVGVEEGDDMSGLPTAYNLHQNYPNPFNPTTTIRFDLPEDAHVKLEVFNLLGQKVETLINGYQTAGYKSISWRTDMQASGIYFYKLETPKKSITRRMTLLK